MVHPGGVSLFDGRSPAT